jgi:type II restriction/modification system DNA methylase subunit YeeA
MNIAQIEINLQKLITTFNKESFIYDLLLAYGLPKASITRLKKGNLNLSKIEGEISWKKKLYFKEECSNDLHLTISESAKAIKHNERFIIVTDYETLLAIDTKTDDKLDCALTDLPKHYDFFLPWAGMEKAQHVNENPADVKAAERMAKLFDEIKKDNPNNSPEFIHSLNVFLSRLLFCFFAEDTHIFEESQFTNAIDSHTQADGSDLSTYLDTLFTVLNTPENKREGLPEYLKAFPYVNGGLFETAHKAPKFSRSSRAAILSGGEQDWSAINPDIFGSMFQAVIGVEQRGNLGQHYTSVPNIMKVIEPLFLNELYEELEKADTNQKKLNALLNRIHKIKIFDPACGSGNFLIIAYKELRILEMKIFKAGNMMALSGMQLSQFYGIEIDDFAGEIAKLALWLAEHQMNVEFYKEFGRTNPTLPLKEAGKIVQGNACRLDWEEVCPKTNAKAEPAEVYILGNPPYLGARMQQDTHKADMDFVFSSFKNYRDLDYIAIWFYKAAKFIKGVHSKCAFVTTNSISQGLQVSLLWPNIFNLDIEIYFAHTSFKWANNAKSNAGVTVAIIGLANTSKSTKRIFYNGMEKQVNGINAYLTDGGETIIQRRSKPISNFNEMSFGNMPNDGGGLILSEEEKNALLSENPEARKYIKKLLGAQEFIRGQIRYCLWIIDKEKENAKEIPFIGNCIEKTRQHRLNSKDEGTNKLAELSYQFRDTNTPINNQIIVPRVSSERREYIPSGFLETDTVISDSALAIYDAESWLFGVLNSKMHMVWIRAVGGRLKTDYRYSKDVVYNTFPFPPISTQRKNEITQAVFRILAEREKHSDKTLAQLYDPDKMPKGLREAHRQNDEIIEKCYRSTPFTSDEERLEYLFKLYEKMILEESDKDTLFAEEKKTGKKRK